MNFYPRSPCGERHNINSSVNTADKISIHALLAESDVFFNDGVALIPHISIHALLAESDLADCTKIYAFGDFYPRSPCGERPVVIKNNTAFSVFLSTLSLRRATGIAFIIFFDDQFLSTLSLRRATRCTQLLTPCVQYFYPRSPCGERRCNGGDKS